MDSLTTPLQQPQLPEDRFATIRRRNKRLILAFFGLIFAVAAVTGGIIVYLIHQHNLTSDPQSSTFKPSTGIREYCSLQFPCISFLSHSIQSTPDSTPTQILRLSLESAYITIDDLLPTISKSTAQNCSSWMDNSLSQLNSTVVELLIDPRDPDEQTRMVMLNAVTAAWNDLKRCGECFNKALFTAAGKEPGLYAATAEVYNAKSLVGYGVDFLENFDMVHENFRYEYSRAGEEGLSRIFEDLGAVTLFGSYYFVLVFLFCLMLRIY